MSKQLTGYEKVGRLFRLLGWVSLIAGVCFGFLLFTQEELKSDKMIGLVVLFFALPILYLPLGKAIKEHRRWGRIVGNIVGVLALFGIPIGTIIGIYVLTLLNKSWDEQPPGQPGRLGIKKKVRELQTKDKEKAKSKKEPMMSEHVVQINNRSTSDNWIVNSTDMHITVACNQPQTGKFSINLQPGQRQRVAPRIQAQPYPYGKQKYDQFQYHLNSSETWEVHLDSGQLVMQTK